MLRKMAAAVYLRVFSVDFATPTVFVENARDRAGFWHSQAAPDPLFCPIAANYHQPPRWYQTAGTFYEKEQGAQDQIGEALQAFFARSIQSGRPFPVYFVPIRPISMELFLQAPYEFFTMRSHRALPWPDNSNAARFAVGITRDMYRLTILESRRRKAN